MANARLLALFLVIATLIPPVSRGPFLEGQETPEAQASGFSEVRLEVPFAVYKIAIPPTRGPVVIDLEPLARCYSEGEARVQQLSAATYVVSALEGRGGSNLLITCVLAPFEINRSSVRAVLAPVKINGSLLAISRIWFPQYLVNVDASPPPDRIYPSGDGYYMVFNASEPRAISIQGLIFHGLPPQPPSPREGQRDPVPWILALIAGGGAGAAATYVFSLARSRLRKRDLEKEILDLLARSQKGMSLSMISKELGSPKSSTWKKLRKLVEKGIVEELEGPGKGKLYRLRRR